MMEWLTDNGPVLAVLVAAWWQLGMRLTKLETQMDLLLRGLRITVTAKEEA